MQPALPLTMLVRLMLVLAIGACGNAAENFDAQPLDAPRVVVEDGPPTRLPCTGTFGSMLTTSFGRLDGILVAIVPPGGGGCNADDTHIHLQVRANNATYDVAINVGTTNDVGSAVFEIPLGGPAWSEGWRTAVSNNYVTLGLHSTDVPLRPKAPLVSELMADLATVNHISIYGTGYGPDGAHLIHRNDNSRDGMVVTQPLSTPSRARLFRFSNQTF